MQTFILQWTILQWYMIYLFWAVRHFRAFDARYINHFVAVSTTNESTTSWTFGLHFVFLLSRTMDTTSSSLAVISFRHFIPMVTSGIWPPYCIWGCRWCRPCQETFPKKWPWLKTPTQALEPFRYHVWLQRYSYFRFTGAILFLRAKMASAMLGNIFDGMAMTENPYSSVGTIQISCLVAVI